MTAHPKTRTRATARKVHDAIAPAAGQPSAAGEPSKLDRMVALLVRPEGASLAELIAATGWQAHSVRGALAGSLKKKGHVIRSEKTDGLRRYRIGAAD